MVLRTTKLSATRPGVAFTVDSLAVAEGQSPGLGGGAAHVDIMSCSKPIGADN